MRLLFWQKPQPARAYIGRNYVNGRWWINPLGQPPPRDDAVREYLEGYAPGRIDETYPTYHEAKLAAQWWGYRT